MLKATRRGPRPLVASAVVLACMLSSSAEGASNRFDASAAGAAYILSTQTNSGSFFSVDYPPYSVAEAISALASTHAGAASFEDALVYMSSDPSTSTDRGGRTGLMIMGIVAAGRDPRTFGGIDWVELLHSNYDPKTGIYDDRNLYSDALGLLGDVAAKQEVPDAAITYVKANQCADSGGFGQAAGCLSKADVDTTSIVIDGLIASGMSKSDQVIERARSFLIDSENIDAGFGNYPEDKTNSNSTGLALTAMAALGEDPLTGSWSKDGRSPVTALLELQTPSGAFKWQQSDTRSSDPATVQALLGLSGYSLPIPAFKPANQARSASFNARTNQTANAGETHSELQATTASPISTEPTPSPSEIDALAGVLVRMANGRYQQRCITVGPSTNGIEALEAAGFRVTTKSFGSALGTAVCRIDGFPGSSDCLGGQGHWHYWHYRGRDWEESVVGPSNYRVMAGTVEGWTWETTQGAAPPRVTTADAICARNVVAHAAGQQSTPKGWRFRLFTFLGVGIAGVSVFARARRRQP